MNFLHPKRACGALPREGGAVDISILDDERGRHMSSRPLDRIIDNMPKIHGWKNKLNAIIIILSFFHIYIKKKNQKSRAARETEEPFSWRRVHSKKVPTNTYALFSSFNRTPPRRKNRTFRG